MLMFEAFEYPPSPSESYEVNKEVNAWIVVVFKQLKPVARPTNLVGQASLKSDQN